MEVYVKLHLEIFPVENALWLAHDIPFRLPAAGTDVFRGTSHWVLAHQWGDCSLGNEPISSLTALSSASGIFLLVCLPWLIGCGIPVTTSLVLWKFRTRCWLTSKVFMYNCLQVFIFLLPLLLCLGRRTQPCWFLSHFSVVRAKNCLLALSSVFHNTVWMCSRSSLLKLLCCSEICNCWSQCVFHAVCSMLKSLHCYILFCYSNSCYITYIILK